MDKNSFDAALRPGFRAALAPSNTALRQAENQAFSRLLDEHGQFLPGASFIRDCPRCQTPSGSASLLLQAHGMHLLRCPVCRLVYSREVINSDFDRQRYQASEASDANLALKIDPHYAALEQDKARYVIQRLGTMVAPGKLLDIGSSTGALLRAAKQSGWLAHGVEINPAAVAYCQQHGLDAICAEYPCVLPAGWTGYDAVLMLDVLEHLPDPLAFLARLAQDMRPGAWLVVQVPNFRSLLITMEGGRNNNICHGHWSYFEAETLSDMMHAAGFEMHFLETYISELDRVKAYPDAVIANAWQQLTDQQLAAPQALTVDDVHQALLGYKLFGLFQKVAA
ncbi:class I SAM-dependent methyltransferase [Aquitalea palustris]|uniref:Class I SAM-dependent methyltransferase n=1 Tax=Aquitalea palustris TaxID=2480983 RepID=A0A454JNZ3_9NEIS|nr:class I SAM-dependent methyltransferase [Aquitalea palustris]RMD02227.1 class I SAM-dependent methyltransferase [Aquitalea palustris]